jgi:hypothetical protein
MSRSTSGCEGSVCLSIDVNFLIRRDIIVRLLLGLTSKQPSESARLVQSRDLSRRICSSCSDEVVRHLRVRHIKFLLKFNRKEVYTAIGRAKHRQALHHYNLAARYDRLAVLMWLRRLSYSETERRECGWSATTCAYAAARGNLDSLKWLRGLEDGKTPRPVSDRCPWSASTYIYATVNRHYDVLRWLDALPKAHACPVTSWMKHATANYHGVADWLLHSTTDPSQLNQLLISESMSAFSIR